MKTILKPELRLKELSRKLRLVCRYCSRLGTPENIIKEAVNIIAKVEFSTFTLKKENLIAITGLQGVGKTTFMKEYYGLSTTDLSIGIEECEIYPVILNEKDIEEIEYYVYFFNYEKVEVERVLLSKEDAVKRMSDVTDDTLGTLYFEVYIPKRYSPNYDPGRSFVLLPGIVDVDSPKGLDNRILHFLAYSTNCIICIDEFSMAGGTNERFIENYVSKFFQNSKPLFAITRADQMGAKKTKNTRNKYIKQLELSEDETDKVLVTGVGDAIDKEWVFSLSDTINKYSATTFEYLTHQKQFLIDTLYEINNLINNIRDYTKEMAIDDILLDDDREIAVFIEYRDKIINSLEKEMKPVMNEIIGNLKKDIEESLIGFGKIRNLLRSDYTRKKRLRDKIQSYWEMELFRSFDKIVTAIENVHEQFKFISGTHKSNPLEKKLIGRIGYLEEKRNTEVELFDEEKHKPVVYTVAHFMGTLSDADKRKKLPLEVHTAMKLIPIAMMEYARLNMLFHREMRKDGTRMIEHYRNRDEIIKGSDLTEHQNISEVLEECSANSQLLSSNTKSVVGSMIALLGVDYLPDRQLNMLQPLLEGIGLKAALATKWAGIIGGAMAASVILLPATMAIRAAHTTNQKNLDAYASAYLDMLSDSAVNSIIDSFKNSFDIVEYRIRDQMLTDNKVSEKNDNLYNLKVQLNELNDVRCDILDLFQ